MNGRPTNLFYSKLNWKNQSPPGTILWGDLMSDQSRHFMAKEGKNKGTYHSTRKSEIFETGTNGKENSWEKFQKIRILLNFRKANHSTENSGNSGMKVKWNGNFQEKIFENLGIPHEVVLFFGIYANSQVSTQR